jgi:nitroimidazol reductase NimA-like FMN-containing flavoprotein (pyridoxamine 5'-phosphate oxidase superfamily)
MPEPFTPTARTTVRRDDRAAYDHDVVRAVFDEALICHVGFVVDGQPYVMPTIHCRIDDVLYLHGSPATRMMRLMKAGTPVCVTATLVDGLVLARSWFHHSMNYRSAVALGVPREVTDPEEKQAAFRALMDQVAPGRAELTRAPDDMETKKTLVAALDLDEVSAKVRDAGVIDDEEDLTLPHWAGVLPLRVTAGPPETDPLLDAATPVPEHVSGWRRP